MSKAMNFSIYVDDMERALRFYSEVFGWKADKFPGGEHYIVSAGEEDEQGVDGFLEPRQKTRSTVNHFRIFSYDETLEKITREGGKILEEMDMGDMGRHAFCEDPDGNVLGLMWENPNFEPPQRPPE